MKKITCVIVSFNNEKFIEQAIESVINQTRKLDEIIIADDFSTDQTRSIISEYAKKYTNIKIIYREKNLGVSANRDLAIREAIGDYITTLDGDDYYYPKKIELEEKLMENSSVVFSDFHIVDKNNNIIHHVKLDKSKFDDFFKRLNFIIFRKGHIPRDMMVTKKLFLKLNGFSHNLKLYEDWDLKIRISCGDAIWRSADYTGLAYRKTEGGLSTAKVYKHLKYQLIVLYKNRKIIIKKIGLANYIVLYFIISSKPLVRKFKFFF